MRLIVARCSIDYTGRLTTHLPEAVRLLMVKADGGVSVWHDGGSSVKPQNWMTPPTVVEEADDRIVVRKLAGATEDRLEIQIAEVLSDVTQEVGQLEGDAEVAASVVVHFVIGYTTDEQQHHQARADQGVR